MSQNVWLIDCNPADVYGSDMVCEPNESAAATVEMLPVSVQFGNEATVWACATCVSWVYNPDGNSSEFSLVFNKLSELTKTPRVLGATLGLSNRHPRAYARQILKDYASLGAFSLRNQPLGNHMVHVFGEARLFPTAFLQQPFCRFGSLALKLGSKFCVPFPDTVNMTEIGRAHV